MGVKEQSELEDVGITLTPTGRISKKDRIYSHNRLVRDIAATSNYNIYEVEDVLAHMAYHIARILKHDDRLIDVRNLGRFRRSVWSARTQYSRLMKRVVTMPERLSVNFVPCRQIKYELNNKEIPEEQQQDEDQDSKAKQD